jgi:hypothetical protein
MSIRSGILLSPPRVLRVRVWFAGRSRLRVLLMVARRCVSAGGRTSCTLPGVCVACVWSGRALRALPGCWVARRPGKVALRARSPGYCVAGVEKRPRFARAFPATLVGRVRGWAAGAVAPHLSICRGFRFVASGAGCGSRGRSRFVRAPLGCAAVRRRRSRTSCAFTRRAWRASGMAAPRAWSPGLRLGRSPERPRSARAVPRDVRWRVSRRWPRFAHPPGCCVAGGLQEIRASRAAPGLFGGGRPEWAALCVRSLGVGWRGAPGRSRFARGPRDVAWWASRRGRASRALFPRPWWGGFGVGPRGLAPS